MARQLLISAKYLRLVYFSVVFLCFVPTYEKNVDALACNLHELLFANVNLSLFSFS